MKYKNTFKVVKVEEIGDKKFVESVNKKGLGNLKIVVPITCEINKGDDLDIKVTSKDD